MTCFPFGLLSRIPLAGLRLCLCRWHVGRCPRCRQDSERREALPPVLVTADRLPAGLDLWPGIRERIAGAQARGTGPAAAALPAPRPWRWAAAAAVLALLLAAGFWRVFLGRRSAPQPAAFADRPALQTRLCSAKIADKPARVFQVQSRNPDRTIFWIARDNSRS
jgi:hypothetical protein